MHEAVRRVEQSAECVVGLPPGAPSWRTPLPFSYESTGAETSFTNRLDATTNVEHHGEGTNEEQADHAHK